MKYLKYIFLFVLPLFAHMAGAVHPNQDAYLQGVANHNMVSTLLDQKPLPIPAGLPEAKLPEGQIPDGILENVITIPTGLDQEWVKLRHSDGKLEFVSLQDGKEKTFLSLDLDLKGPQRVTRLITDSSEKFLHFIDLEFDMQNHIVGIRGLNLTQQVELVFPGFDMRMGGIDPAATDFSVIQSRTALTLIGKDFTAKRTAWHAGPNTVLSFSGDFEFGAIGEEKAQLTLNKNDGKTLETPITQLTPDGSYITGFVTGSLFGLQARNITFKAGMVDGVDLLLVPSNALNTLANVTLIDQKDVAIQKINIEHAYLNLGQFFWIAKEMNVRVPTSAYKHIAFNLPSEKSQYIFSKGPQPRLRFKEMFLFGTPISIDDKNALHASNNQNINPLWVLDVADPVTGMAPLHSIDLFNTGNVTNMDQLFHDLKGAHEGDFMKTTAGFLAQALGQSNASGREWTSLFSVDKIQAPNFQFAFGSTADVTWPAISYSFFSLATYTADQVI